jgi:hypothetical protein
MSEPLAMFLVDSILPGFSSSSVTNIGAHLRQFAGPEDDQDNDQDNA